MSVRAVAVALVAAATLAFEILLVRVFAIEHFHHIAYMAIGVAMLGIGASGTLVAVLGGLSPNAAQRWFPAATLFTALALMVTPALLHRISLDLTQLAWSMEQWVRLGVVYLLLAFPFASSAVAILLGITLERARPGWIYGASFVGSGVGALLAVAVLWTAHPSRALAMPALVAALGGAVAVGSRTRMTNRFLAAVTVLAASLVALRPPWHMTVSPYKGLPQVEAYPNARRVAERIGPLGWVVAVQAPAFRHAPGLSLAYAGEFPPQTALFVDGEIAGAVTRWGSTGIDRTAMEILAWLPTALPYALGERKRVLVLGGGAMDVWSAVAHGAERIVAVELNADLIGMSGDLAPLPTRKTTPVEIDWVAGDARTVVARTHERFDLITLAPHGGLSGAAGGVHALNEDFLHTTDAYAQYLRRLTADGVLAITQWITVPPREAVRGLLTAAEALRRVMPVASKNGIVLARSWGTTTILVKPSGFSSSDMERLGTWTASRQLDLDWYPEAVSPVAQYHIPDDQTLVHAARAAVTHRDSARHFADAYVFAVAPATDARPYPHRFLRAGSVRTLLRSGSTTWLPFAEWGYVALLATLAQSALLATLLILLPAVVRPRGARGPDASLLPLVAYFSAIGLGYMAAEIALIQQLTLLLGHPVYAVATVLAAILIFSGVGSVWSDRLAPSRASMLGALLAAALALCAALLLDIVHLLQPATIVLRGAAAGVLLVPVAVGMGMLFPIGLRGLAGDDSSRIAWGWAANGFASVVGVPLAALIAVEAGSRVLLLVAATAYVGAALCGRRDWLPRA
jgi:hypothetical protein